MTDKPLAVVSSDNSHYRDFAPVCQDAWLRIGFSFFHAQLGCDEYPEIPGIPTSLQAQVLRIYASTKLQNRLVILSDIDMLPLSARYFHNLLPSNSKSFSVASSHAYRRGRFPICYISAYSKVLADVLLDHPQESWIQFATRMNSLGFGWNTDELYCTGRILASKYTTVEHKRLWIKGFAFRRIDRALPLTALLPYPLDCHCPRPYSEYRAFVDKQSKRSW